MAIQTGTPSDDYLVGTAGDDTINGLAGNDVVIGGLGNDTLDGGADWDLLDYTQAAGPVTVNLVTGHASGADGNDTFTGFESVAGSAFDDLLIGAAGSNQSDRLYGGGGNDTIVGGPGYDHIDGGTGDDQIDGGGGGNWLTFNTAQAGVQVNLATGVATGDGNDRLANIQNLNGTQFNDSLIGNALDNSFQPGPGDDVVIGGGGRDSVNLGWLASDQGETVDLVAGTATGGGGTDTLTGIANVIGSYADDVIKGSSADNSLQGNDGNDQVWGGAGNDYVSGEAGDDQLWGEAGDDQLTGGTGLNSVDGGDGVDTLLTYSSRLQYTVAPGINGSAVFTNASTGEVTTAINVEYAQFNEGNFSLVSLLAGTATDGDDFLVGDANANVIDGLAGNDTLIGLGGDDTLRGSAGNDTIEGGPGDDTLDGGESWDWLDYSQASGPVDVDLATGQATGADGNDQLANFEGLRGSAHADYLKLGGSSGGQLEGGDGDDVLVGSDGYDYFIPGAGNDVIQGGAGQDTLNMSSVPGGVSVNLATGIVTGQGTDTVSGIELVYATGNDDTLVGDAADNTFYPGPGDDSVSGGKGVDTVDYGWWTDGTGVHVNLTTGQASGGAGNDSLNGIENINGSYYDDVLIGDAGANVLNGQNGNDLLDGGGGDDRLVAQLSSGKGGGPVVKTLVGGAGVDTADFSYGNQSITASLASGTITAGGTAAGTLSEIENLIGSWANDVLTGDLNANQLDGGSGDDSLSGGDGNDTLIGGAGADTLLGGGGDDLLYTDAISGGKGINAMELVDGGDGDDILVLDAHHSNYSFTPLAGGSTAVRWGNGSGNFITLSHVERVQFSDGLFNLADVVGAHPTEGNDVLWGDDAANVIDGLGGNDTIFGLGGNDTLLGGAGYDTLVGGAGDDHLDGGAGYDFLDYGQSSGPVSVNLATGLASGADGNDTVTGFEAVIGSAFDDQLTGPASSSSVNLLGGAGNDTIIGGQGSDYLDGGPGNDTLDGTGGSHSGGFLSAQNGVQVNLLTGVATGDGNDTLIGIANLYGTFYDDVIIGSAAANTIQGQAGNDVIRGGDGNDHLYGDAGDDQLHGEAGDDLLQGGAGTNTVDGGDGTDTLLIYDSHSNFSMSAGANGTAVFANSATGEVTTTINVEEVQFNEGTFSVQSLIYGLATEGNDLLVGDANANLIDGLGGDDQILGMAGNDTLRGSAGNDTLSGGEGDDVLEGGADDDMLLGGIGNDMLDGGTGGGAADYSAAMGSVAVNLATGLAGGADGNDVLVAIDTVYGSGFDDQLIGDALSNGLVGAGGNDLLDGGDGDDYLQPGPGDDVVRGGAGVDTLYLQSAPTGVSVNLVTGLVTGEGMDMVSGIERVFGTAYSDTLIGDDADNELYPGKGDDRVDGGGGFDTVYLSASGGLGANVNLLTGVVSGSAGNDTWQDIEKVVGTGFADVFIGDDRNNVLDGRGGADALDGRGGDDVLMAWPAAATLVGGDGVDTADYSRAGSGVTVSLPAGTAAITGGISLGTLAGIENIIGSGGADSLLGDGSDNRLVGGAGNDLLTGGNGADILSGGKGDDQLFGGNGNDQLVTDQGNDVLDGGAGDDTAVLNGTRAQWAFNHGVGSDWILISASQTIKLSGLEFVTTADATIALADLLNTPTSGDDTLSGDAQANTISGQAGNDLIHGYGGDDTLRGDGGNDQLFGDEGNDVLDGGAGNDTLAGGTGSDRYLFGSASGADVISEANSATDLDIVQIDAGVASANVRPSRAGDDLVLSIAPTGATLTVSGYFAEGASTIERIYFGDGSSWSLATVRALVNKATPGNDVLIGYASNDTLNGGLGRDTLTGAGGSDKFVFNAADGLINPDTITDFAHGVDKIQLSASVFTALAPWVGTTIAGNGNANLLYDASSGVLSYDADGAGAGAAIPIVLMGAASHPGTLAGDIVVVA